MARIVTVSDFNVSNFTALLNNNVEEPEVCAVEAPFGQAYQVLADDSHPLWADQADCLIVWTQPQRVISSFALALNHEVVDTATVLMEVEQFAGLIRARQKDARTILVPSWVLPEWERGIGLLDLRRGTGIRDLLMRMNQRLAECLEEPAANVPDAGAAPSSVFMLDSQRWCAAAGARAWSTKAWYLGKIPFGNEVFKQAAVEVKAALRAVGGAARKLVVVDLDDTLWGGIVGDVGWQNLTLGGHDGEGEALVDFQHALKALTRRGILLGIVSKNEEETALTALQQHPEMVLRQDDFAGWRINWNDKARNVAELAVELNLGLQSVVFIDDNPLERARVREALPEVLVPEWPADKTQYRKSLLELSCFDVPTLTQEDRQRAAMYASERERKQALSAVGSLDDWLGSLDVTVEVEMLNQGNLPRATQLLNKTNQMNLATRRLTEAELWEWAGAPGHRTWTFKVGDKFGDSGLTGLLSVETDVAKDGAGGDEPSARVVDFVLSCRVMGRKIEESMLSVAIQEAREKGVQVLIADYEPTSKNKPCLEFFQRSGLREETSDSTFVWEVGNDYPLPRQVRVLMPDLTLSSRDDPPH